MVFSLDDTIRLPGASNIPAIKYPPQNIARRAVQLLLEEA